MDIKDIYKVPGYISDEGRYESRPKFFTYMAECRLHDEEGFSYYSFADYDELNDEYTNRKLVRIESIIPLIDVPNIKRLSGEDFEELEQRFETIIENQYGYRVNKKDLTL